MISMHNEEEEDDDNGHTMDDNDDDDDMNGNNQDGIVDTAVDVVAAAIEMTGPSQQHARQQQAAAAASSSSMSLSVRSNSSNHNNNNGSSHSGAGAGITTSRSPLPSSSSSTSNATTTATTTGSTRGMRITTANETPTLPTVMKEKTRTLVHRFFYPHQHKQEYIGTTVEAPMAGSSSSSLPSSEAPQKPDHHHHQQHKPQSQPPSHPANDALQQQQQQQQQQQTPPRFHHHPQDTIETKHTPNHDEELRQQHMGPDMNDPDVQFVTNFWTTYDDILILSIFTQLGIVFRLAMAIWFKYFDDVFSNESALFVNLPLNCLSCFFMGLLCSGERLMETIATRFSPTETQQTIVSLSSTQQHQQQQLPFRPYHSHNDNDDDDNDDVHDYGARYQSNGSLNSRSGSPRVGNDGLIVPTNDFRQRRTHYTSNDNNNRLNNLLRRRRPKRDKQKKKYEPRFVSWQPPVSLDAELRDVQLLALERRIRMSKCLVLFPVRKQDVDVMEHYFQQGYKRQSGDHENPDDDDDFAIDNDSDDDVYDDDDMPRLRRNNNNNKHNYGDRTGHNNSLNVRPRRLEDRLPQSYDQPQPQQNQVSPTTATTAATAAVSNTVTQPKSHATIVSPGEESVPSNHNNDNNSNNTTTAAADVSVDYMTDITDLANNIQDNVQENLYRLRRVNLADGWDTGTTASAMSDDLMLGLRDGFCGALSSFSSWNSAMVALLRKGQFTQALVGYMIGLQLPIVAYRFGQHVAVYIFIWRTRQETHKDERRGGYGIRLANHDDDDDDNDDIEQRRGDGNDEESDEDDEEKKRKAAENELPSLRAVITAIFIMALVTQCTSIFLYNSPIDREIALSLLFSPLGVLARWRLTKLNRWKPTFPLGTFTCNILACALSGTLGDTNQVVLVSIVNGFGGTLSSLASFVVEILAGIDPILFRFDGVIYAAASIGCAMVVGFIFSASVEWADSVVSRTAAVTPNDIDVVVSNVTENLTRYW